MNSCAQGPKGWLASSAQPDRFSPFGDAGAAMYDNDASRMPERYKHAHTIQNEIIIRALSCHLGDKHKVVIDLGAGTANDGLDILAKAPRAFYVGLDNSPPMIRRAREKMERAGFAERSMFLERSFLTTSAHDVVRTIQDECIDGEMAIVMSALALHHDELEEKHSAYVLAHDLLQSGGLFLLTDLFSNHIPCCACHAFERELKDVRDVVRVSRRTSAITGVATTFSVNHYKHVNKPQQLASEISLIEKCGFARPDLVYRHGQLAVVVAERK